MVTKADLDQYHEVIDYLNTCDQEERRRKKHRLPIECYAASDCEFLFTLCARRHGQPFIRPELAKAIIDSLLWRKRRHGWILFCYCLMPEHLHFILRLTEEQLRYRNAGARGVVPESVLDHLGYFKSYTTTQIWWPHGGRGALWQQSSHDRLLRFRDSVEAAVLYVLNNPVRRELVEQWENYPYAAIVDAIE